MQTDLSDISTNVLAEQDANEAHLCSLLEQAVEHDEAYQWRYGLVLRAAALAVECGFPAGFRIDPDEPEWPVAFIELPTGQVSWHMPQHPQEWDGHTTQQKFERINAFGEAIDF